MRDVSISSFFYLELWLRPDGTLKLSDSCCRSCAGRLQVPCQPGLHRKFLNQNGRLLRVPKNAQIWSTGAALMRALAAVASVFNTLRGMRILFRSDTEDKFALKSRHPKERRI